MSDGKSRHAPMPRVEFEALLALAQGPCHGYEMMKSMAGAGGTAPSPGTLYVALRRLAEAGLIRELAAGAGARSRRRYRLTSAGRSALARELERLESLMARARAAGWQPSGGGLAS